MTPTAISLLGRQRYDGFWVLLASHPSLIEELQVLGRDPVSKTLCIIPEAIHPRLSFYYTHTHTDTCMHYLCTYMQINIYSTQTHTKSTVHFFIMLSMWVLR